MKYEVRLIDAVYEVEADKVEVRDYDVMLWASKEPLEETPHLVFLAPKHVILSVRMKKE